MATYTDTYGFNKGSASFPNYGANKATLIEVELDFAAIAAARVTAGATALAATDVLQAITLPAGTLVLAVGADVTTAEGATLTIDVGDGSDTDGWLDGFNANTAAAYCSIAPALTEGTPNTLVPAYGQGKFYSAADTIDVLINNNGIDTCVIRLWALVVNVSGA